MYNKIFRCFNVWKDEFNNSWDAMVFSKNQAQKAADSLTDCHDCKNCFGCTNCVYCTNCVNCDSCERCIDCAGCENCSYCINCKDCIECTECECCDAAIDSIKLCNQQGNSLSSEEEDDLINQPSIRKIMRHIVTAKTDKK
jgi:hypothetical protein